MRVPTVLQVVLCVVSRNFVGAALSSDEVLEVTETCCSHGQNFAVTAASVKLCAGAGPPEDIEPEQLETCNAAIKRCCEQLFKEKDQCTAGIKYAAEKRCSVPRTDIGKSCCDECSIGTWTGESRGKEACGDPPEDDYPPNTRLRKNAYYKCCLEAAEKPETTTPKRTTTSTSTTTSTTPKVTTTTKKATTTTKKPRERCKVDSCDHMCNDDSGKIVCSCREGYRLKADKKTCKDINECAEAVDDLCTVEGTVCHNTPGAFKCVPIRKRDVGKTCPPGFKRNVANQVCDDINECQLPRPPCPKYLCENTIGGYKCAGKPGKPFEEAVPGVVTTPATATTPSAKNDICPSGFRAGPDDECIDIDECEEHLDDCQRLSQHCINTHGSYFCQDHVSKRCAPGFKVNAATGICEDIDECEESSEVCKRTEICVNMPGQYTCKSKISTLPKLASKTCQEGTRLKPGGSVCEDIDECREGTHLCDQFQNCINTFGGHECRCKNGFELDSSGSCVDIDECALKLDNCAPGTYCLNVLGTFTCTRRPPSSSTTTLAPLSDYEYYYDSGEDNATYPDTDRSPVPTAPPQRRPITSITTSTPRARPVVTSTNTTVVPPPPPLPPRPSDPRSSSTTSTTRRPYPRIPYRPSTPSSTSTPSTATRPEWTTPRRPATTTTRRPEPTTPRRPEPTTPRRPDPTPPRRPDPTSPRRPDSTTPRRTEPTTPRISETTTSRRPDPITPRRPYPTTPRRPESPIPPRIPIPGKPDPFDVNVPAPVNTTTIEKDKDPDGSYGIDTGVIPKDRWTNVIGKETTTAIPDDFDLENLHCLNGFEKDSKGLCVDVDECESNTHICTSLEVCENMMGGYICNCRPGYKREASGQCVVAGPSSTTGRTTSTGRIPTATRTTTPRATVTEPSSPTTAVTTPRSPPPRRPDVSNRRPSRPYAPPTNCDVGYEYNDERGTCVDIDECTTNRANCSPNERCVNMDGGYRCVCSSSSRRCQPTYRPDYRADSRPGYRPEDRPDYELEKPNYRPSTSEYRPDSRPEDRPVTRPENRPSYVVPPRSDFNSDPQVITVGAQYGQRGPRYTRPSLSRSPIGAVLRKCPWGYKLTSDHMCLDIDECAKNTSECGPEQTCENFYGGYSCQCPAGHKLAGQDKCEDIDECQYSQPCHYNSKCINTVGSYRCECGKGFRNAPSNDKICVDIDECSETPSVCEQGCANAWGGYRCYCKPGYRLRGDNRYLCVNIDECSETSSVCEQGCANAWGGYRCNCKQGYRLRSDNRTCEDVDECAEWSSSRHRGRLCGGECVNTPGSYKCSCPKGYRLSEDGRSCIDIDECETGEATCARAGPGEVCQNTRGSYHCHRIDCPRGYRLESKHRCSRIQRSCLIADWSCLQQPSAYTYNFITFVANIYLPDGSVDLFTMHGPAWRESAVNFELRMIDVQAPRGVKPADLTCFDMRPSGNVCVISLLCSLEGPQVAELELTMTLHQRGQFAGSAVARLIVIVSAYEF